MLYENMISQILVSKGKQLYFYTRYNKEKHRNDIETDFLLSNESKWYNTTHNSFDTKGAKWNYGYNYGKEDS